MGADLSHLPLNSLLTAAFITYLPLLPEEARGKVQRDWLAYLKLEVSRRGGAKERGG